MKRNCNNCGAEYEADSRNLKRGWGLSCSKSCAAQQREKDKAIDSKKTFEVSFTGFIEIEAIDAYHADAIMKARLSAADRIEADCITETKLVDGVTEFVERKNVLGYCGATWTPIFEDDDYFSDSDGNMYLQSTIIK